MRSLSIFILSFVLVGFISNGETGDKTEARYNEPGYAYDSGSFSLPPIGTFTYISVLASVQNGVNSPYYDVMYAEAYIELDNCSIRASATGKTSDYDFAERDINGCHYYTEWYWVIQASENPGTGTARCYWEWYLDF